MKDYDEKIRPAIAVQFLGWKNYQREHPDLMQRLWRTPDGKHLRPYYALPDPLRNPADRAALEDALIDRGYSVGFKPIREDLQKVFRGKIVCYFNPLGDKKGYGDTPAQALIAVWDKQFGGEV